MPEESESPEYFIALCKRDRFKGSWFVSPHHSLLVGYTDPVQPVQSKFSQGNKTYPVLFAAGMVYLPKPPWQLKQMSWWKRQRHNFTESMNAIFSSVNATLFREFGMRRESGYEEGISYKAFGISQETYNTFLGLSKQSAARPGLMDYRPAPEQHYRSLNLFPSSEPSSPSLSLNQFGYSNDHSCRASAIRILQHLGIDPRVGASYFNHDLPCHGIFAQRQLYTPMVYVLPTPPNRDQLLEAHYKILDRIYKQLEKLPQKWPESDLTKQKFQKLKQLYEGLSQGNIAAPILCKNHIAVWKRQNQTLVQRHRGSGLFALGRTETQIMLRDIESASQRAAVAA